MARLILLRHPETALNKKHGNTSSERIRGWVDVPLDKHGKAELVGLAAKYGRDVGRVYSSDLIRAKQAAQAVAKVGHVPLIVTNALRPWNLGILHGKEVNKVIALMNKCVEHPDVVVPKGECFRDFARRYLTLLSRLVGESRGAEKDIVAVTHSRNVQLARAWAKKGYPPDFSYDIPRMLDYKDEIPPAGEYVVAG